MMRLWASAFFMSLVALSAFVSIAQLGLPSASLPVLYTILTGVVFVGAVSGFMLLGSLRQTDRTAHIRGHRPAR